MPLPVPARLHEAGMAMSVTVIGAGVAGLTPPGAVGGGGPSVTTLDQAASLGNGACSWLAGGMLAPGCERESAEPLISDWGMEELAYWPARHAANCQRGTLVG